MTELEAYERVCSDYALSSDPAFSLQHVVDAHTAQHASELTKPIAAFFALVGLFLRCEKNYTGREVQRVHQLLAGRKQTWPQIAEPAHRGEFTASDVARHPAGPHRDAAVDRWCRSVWQLYAASHESIRREMRARQVEI